MPAVGATLQTIATTTVTHHRLLKIRPHSLSWVSSAIVWSIPKIGRCLKNAATQSKALGAPRPFGLYVSCSVPFLPGYIVIAAVCAFLGNVSGAPVGIRPGLTDHRISPSRRSADG